MKKGSLLRFGFAAGLSLLLCFSFAWVWHVGHRGLFLLDQSIAFDGAWRIAQGQVPYRDFLMPFGPVGFLLPALFFRVAGPSFSALVAAASVLSLLGTAVAVRLCWRLTGSRALALLGGALTAVWFQAPFGVPWMEQTAFFFDLLALACVVEQRVSARSSIALAVLAGVASALAVLSKQNAGGLFGLVALGGLLVPLRGRAREALRAALGYAAGGVATALAFALWVQTYSDFRTFWHYWVEVSAETGISRVETWKLMGTAFFQTVVSSSVPLFGFATVVGIAAWCWLLRPMMRASVRTESALCAFLALALPQFHNAFQLTTNNDVANNNAFVGVCFVAALALALSARRYFLDWGEGELSVAARYLASGWPWRIASIALFGCVAYSFGDGLLTARDRNVQEFFGARFEQPLAVAGMERVVWGEPTRITPHFCGNLGDTCKLSDEVARAERPLQILQREDFERVAKELRSRDENFFVFPDATLLYGLSGRVSPQPLLYFHPGQSFLPADRAELDRRILESLKRHHVTVIVLERVSFMGTQRELAAFPKLHAWVASEFESALELGNYRVLRARASRPALAEVAPP
jgi:hypothetical protein